VEQHKSQDMPASKSWKTYDCAVPQHLMAPECEFLGASTMPYFSRMAEAADG
jgi:hypothetical protein